MLHLAALLTLPAFLAAPVFAQVWGSACAGGAPSPYVAALQSHYPAYNARARLVANDNEARQLFASIQTGEAHALPPLPDSTTCPRPHTFGFGIDDGPHCLSRRLHAQLAEHDIKASVFYIGSQVATLPQEARNALAAGHELCVHTWSHPRLTECTEEEIFAELYYTKRIIKQVTGYSSRCFRPPYGDIDDRVRRIAAALELHPVMWNTETADWSALVEGPARTNAAYAAIIAGEYSQTGALVVSHESHDPAIDAWMRHFAALQRTFRHFVPSVSACLNITRPYAEPNGPTYPEFAGYIDRRAPHGSLRPPLAAGQGGQLVFSGQEAFRAAIAGQAAPPTSSSSSSAPTRTLSTSVRPSSIARTSSSRLAASAISGFDPVANGAVKVSLTRTCLFGLILVTPTLLFS